MARYNKPTSDGPSSEDKALNLFAEMMIEKIESINKDWKKPWFTEGALQWPKNLNGREYNGLNAFMLLLQCEKQGWKIPRFCTFDCVQRLNNTEKKNANGEALPRVSVLKGERSFPVFITTFTCIDKDTKGCRRKKGSNTMYIRRCRYIEFSMWHKPICKRHVLKFGQSWRRRICARLMSKGKENSLRLHPLMR